MKHGAHWRRCSAPGTGDVEDLVLARAPEYLEDFAAADEADRCSPLLVAGPGRVGGMQPQLNILVARDYRSPADCVRGLPVMVFEVEPELVGEQIACQDCVGAGVDQAIEDSSAATGGCERYLHEWAKHGLSEPR